MGVAKREYYVVGLTVGLNAWILFLFFTGPPEDVILKF